MEAATPTLYVAKELVRGPYLFSIFLVFKGANDTTIMYIIQISVVQAYIFPVVLETRPCISLSLDPLTRYISNSSKVNIDIAIYYASRK